MSSKKMPQEHRIKGLLPGEVEWINNNPKSPEQIEETKEYL